MSGKDFDSYIENAEYLKIYGLTFDKERLMFIESEQDRFFWENFLKEHEVLDSFKFSFHTKGKDYVRGKSTFSVDKLAAACREVVYALDSDLDYIASNRNEKAVVINENKYVLQTYAFSVENVKLQKECLNECVCRIRYFEPHDYRFDYFIDNYSQFIYSLSTKYYFLVNERECPPSLNDKVFHHHIIPERNALISAYFDNDWTGFEEQLKALGDIIEFDLWSDEKKNKYSDYVGELNSKGIDSNSIYLYVRGHDYEEKIVKTVIKELTKRVREKEISLLRAEPKTQQYRDKTREIHNHFSTKCSADTIIYAREDFKVTELYGKISNDVRAIA